MNNKKHVIFDLGGVLVRFNPKELLLKLFPDDTAQMFAFSQAVDLPEWGEMDRGTLSFEQVAHKLSDRYDYNKFLHFLYAVLDDIQPIDQGLELLHAVKTKGHSVYILSNMNRQCYEKVSSFPNFLPLFDGAVFSYQVNLVKPEPAIYHYFLKNYQLAASDCVFIDDRIVNVQAGLNVGIDSILCTDYQQVRKDLQSRLVI